MLGAGDVRANFGSSSVRNAGVNLLLPPKGIASVNFIVEHIVARLPNFVLTHLYSNHRLRKGIIFRLDGITINRKLAELTVALTVRSRFPVELSRIDFTLTWNYKDYFTQINEDLAQQIPYLSEVTVSFRKKLTVEELSSVRDGMLFLAGDAELKTNFADFTRILDLKASVQTA